MANRIKITRDDSLLRVSLARPEKHNAFDDSLIEEISSAFRGPMLESGVRLILLEAEGKSFSAGADLEWMGKIAGFTIEENEADALRLEGMFRAIAEAPVPVIARVHGAAYGGGVGLVAACDIAIASTDARFAFSEVRLGIIPAVIAPYVLRKMAAGEFRRYALTGERFDAEEARRIGLVQLVVAPDALDAAIDRVASGLLAGGPLAQRSVKELLDALASARPAEVAGLTARWIARLRASEEGREGIQAFLQRLTPGWGKPGDDGR